MSICSRFLEFCLKSSCQVWRQGVIGLLFGVSHVTSCCQIFKIITEHTSRTFLAKPSKKNINRVNKIRMNNLNTYFLAVTATQEAHLSVCNTFETLLNCNIALLQHCNIRTLQLYNFATLQHCSIKTLKLCNI